MSEVFRERVAETPEPTPEKPAEVTGIVEDKTELEIHTPDNNSLENWEIENGKYGMAYFGIKEIGKTFPLNAQFGIVDKYIKAELEERGYDKSPAKWQEILKELEDEAGSTKLNSYERLKKLASLVNIIKKQKALKAKRELYKSFKQGDGKDF